MNNENQAKITVEWLYRKGYTIAAAARAIKCSTNNVWAVLHNQRVSAPVVDALRSLPTRPFALRERIKPHNRRRPSTVA